MNIARLLEKKIPAIFPAPESLTRRARCHGPRHGLFLRKIQGQKLKRHRFAVFGKPLRPFAPELDRIIQSGDYGPDPVPGGFDDAAFDDQRV